MIFGLVMAGVAMVVATVWPTGSAPSAPRRWFFSASASSFPLIVIAIQIGIGPPHPVAGTLLALAVVFGLWVDNHGWAGAPSAAQRQVRSIASTLRRPTSNGERRSPAAQAPGRR